MVMDDRIAAVLETAISEERKGQQSPCSDTVLNLLTWLKATRKGRDDADVAALARQVTGFDVTSALLPGHVPEIVTTAFRELRDEPAARPWLIAMVCEPEDVQFAPLSVDLLVRMWHDPRVRLALLPIVTLAGLMDEYPEGRREIERWAARDDEAGAQARELLSS